MTRVVIDLARDAQYHVESAGADGRDLRIGFATPAAKPAKPRDGRVEHARRARRTSSGTADTSALQAPVAPGAPEPAPAPQASAAVAPAGATCRTSSHRHRPATVAPLAPHRPPRPAAEQYSGHPVSLDFQGADLRAVLRTFAEISGLNIVIDPPCRASVDVSLRDVPWDQALDIILRANKLGYSLDGTIVRVAPLNVLADEEKQRRQLAEQQALAGRAAGD